jgi:hypothetical protein
MVICRDDINLEDMEEKIKHETFTVKSYGTEQ